MLQIYLETCLQGFYQEIEYKENSFGTWRTFSIST